MNHLPSPLLCIGDVAERLLPDLFTAVSCCAAPTVGDLDVFCISSHKSADDQIQALASDLTDVHHILEQSGEASLFPNTFRFDSCSPEFRSAKELSENPCDSLLISALRGKDVPLSFRTDREAVEWCFADLLSRPDNPSVFPLIQWIERILSSSQPGIPARLTCMADISDPFSSGILLSLLSFLKDRLQNRPVSVYLIALAETASPLPDSFMDSLYASLCAIDERNLLRNTDPESSGFIDAAWMLSMPSSMIESSDSFRFVAPFAAKILGSISSKASPPSSGLHTVETAGVLSVSMLGEQALPFVAAINLFTWLVTDILPSARNYLAHSGRLRSIAINPRTSLFRYLFSDSLPEGERKDRLDLIERTVKKLLSNILRYMRSVPSSLRLTPENASLWQQAVEACGRMVTVAAEYDVSSAEAHENGLDTVRPVHRVSMADTDEEQLLRRLEEMKKQLDAEEKSRDTILSSIGGYRSMQVRIDCLNRCRTALNDVQSKTASLTQETDHLSVLKLERRIRLLQAAISRCESELSPDRVSRDVSMVPKHLQPEDPYSGIVFVQESCHILEKILQEETNNPILRYIPLFPEIPEQDLKARWKSMLSSMKEKPSGDPLPCLLSEASRICSEEAAVCRFLSRSDMPDLPLLPDLVPHSPLIRIRDLLSLFPQPNKSDRTGELRGLFSMLLLRHYRRRSADEASLCSVCNEPSGSPVLTYWLSSNKADKVFILSLDNSDGSQPFALIIPDRCMITAKLTDAAYRMIPSFAIWFDRDSNTFLDPRPFLGEGDKKLLCQCLDSYVSSLSDRSSMLYGFLSSFRDDLFAEDSRSLHDSDLKTRIHAVCALRNLPAYSSSLTVSVCCYEHFLPDDILGICITGKKEYPANICSDIPEENLFSYKGIPFAREDSSLLLAATGASGEDHILKSLASECALLSEYSDDFRDAVVRNTRELIDRFPDARPDARLVADTVIEDAVRPVENREPVFEWPWDIHSPSMLTVLRECLGDTLAVSALMPFSDLLAVFPARGYDVIGDSLLSSMCAVPPHETYAAVSDSTGIAPDAVLPPFSTGFGNSLCSLPEGRTLIRPGMLRFERNMNDTFRVTMTLDGSFPVHLVRVYDADEILYLYSHDIPSVAVWPSVPFPAEDWKAYYVYAHLPESYTASVLPEGGVPTSLVPSSAGRFTASLDSFPVSISLFRNEKSIGVMPNVLPRPVVNTGDAVEICVDFGSSGTSVVFSCEHRRKPLSGPVMVRTILNNPASSPDLLRREFLPAVPVSALLPTVSRIFRNVPGSDPIPFADGIVLMSSDIEDLLSTPSDAIYTSLKWEEQKGRSGFLCLHQVLLMAALQARCDGAPSVSWRFALPDEMAKEGKEYLKDLFLSICDTVLHESGYAVPPEGVPVSFASDSAALGAYFRFCAPDDTRGGFMVLDLGSCTADISLFLRGREQAVRTCQIPLGIHYMLLPFLLSDPELLLRELSFTEDMSLRRDLSLLAKSLNAARTDAVALRRARISLDYLISDHLPALISCLLRLTAGGTATKTGALMLFYFSYLFMLSGLVLLQIAADPGKSDFLPEQMALCLAGRGSSLIEALPAQLKTSLWRFLSMFRNKRVASLSFLFSAEKKMEIPVGLSMLQEVYHMLPPSSAVPASLSVRPAELLPEFLLRFRREFPASSEILFPGFYANDYYHPFTERGDMLISASIEHSFPPSDMPRPYDSLASWPGNLLDLLS